MVRFRGLTCGTELVLPQPLDRLPALFLGQPPTFPRLHDLGHLLKVLKGERHVCPIVAVLGHLGERQGPQPLHDFTRPPGAGRKPPGVPRADVAVHTQQDHVPRILDPGILTVFAEVAFFIDDLESVAESGFQVGAIHTGFLRIYVQPTAVAGSSNARAARIEAVQTAAVGIDFHGTIERERNENVH